METTPIGARVRYLRHSKPKEGIVACQGLQSGEVVDHDIYDRCLVKTGETVRIVPECEIILDIP